jgi:ABC-2 type transport system ATP-binding protein
MSDAILEAKGLTVRFGRKTALRDVGVAFAAGETAVIAGSNGAGKSTLLRCLAGVIVPDRGRVVAGPGLTRAKIGFVSDSLSLYEGGTLGEVWRLHRDAFGIAAPGPSRIEGLELDSRRRVKSLSAGERTLFHLSLLLAQRPAVLLVDEVIHALDPFLREKFLEAVIGAMDELKTAVVMVNHTLSDTAQIPERVLIMDDGRIVLDERRESLERSVKRFSGEADLPPDIPCLFAASSEFRKDRYVYPFREEWRKRPGLRFEDIGLDEIVKAFIGGAYVQKRAH